MKIAITGVPCVGKTTVSKLLAKRLGYRYVSVNDIADRIKAYEGYDKATDSKIINIKKINKKIKEMENVVIDGHVSHLLPVDTVIVLRLNPEVLKKRLEKKYPTNKFKVRQNLEAEVLGVISGEACEHKRAYEIDVTGKKAEDVVKDIVDVVKGKSEGNRIGSVEWDEYIDLLLVY